MNTTIMLPVGNAILGRVLNASGEPIDHKGSLENVPRTPLATPEALSHTTDMPTRLLETGIKVIDVMAPLAYGSVVGLVAGYGLGKEVVVEEIMQHLLTNRLGLAVIAGMRETTYDASSLHEMVREAELEDRITMLFEQTTEDVAVRQRLLHAAMTIAAHFGADGREVLLMIDSQVISKEQIAGLRRFANARGITTLLFVPVNDLHQPTDSALLNDLDAQLWFSQTRAKRGLWPAIDPLASCSHFLANEIVTSDHQQVAQRVREVLQRFYELREQKDRSSLSEVEQHLMARGERIDLFFSQPFVVAEAYTDVPGTYLTREESLHSFRALLDGYYDNTPIQAFKFVGQIEV